MKRLLAYLYIVLGLGLTFNVSVEAEPVTIASWGGAYTEMQRLGPAAYAEKKNRN